MKKYACGNEVRVGDKVERVHHIDPRLFIKGKHYIVSSETRVGIYLEAPSSEEFANEYFKLISREGDTTMKTKQFTKADLKTGHRVTTASGRVWTVLKDVPPQTLGDEDEEEGILVYDHGWMDIKGLDENFVYTTDKHYSLIKVEQVTLYCNYLSKQGATVILWEREAPKSKEQIAYDEAVEATEAARQAYELAQKKLEALNPAKKA